jgi:hypothetical protein
MSLFQFGFSKRPTPQSPQTSVTDNVTVKTEIAEADGPFISTTIVAGTSAINEHTDDSHETAKIPINERQPQLLQRQRDPSFPVGSESVDSEVKQGPVPVEQQKSGHSGRGFRSEWNGTRKWLEYSKTLEKSFCFPCRLFGKNMTDAQRLGHEAFISKGFNDWKNAQRGFSRHESSQLHRICDEMLHNRMKQLQDSANNPCIGASLSAAFRERQVRQEQETSDNRKYIGRLSGVMQLLMRLGLAVRGHRESEESLHRGNFRELIELIRKTDTFLDDQVISRPGNAHYMSPESQNEMIDAIGDEVLCTIVKEATAAEFFAISMDETTDLAHLEQVAIVIRYCDGNFRAIERLLAVTESANTTGEALAKVMLDTLSRNGLSLDKLCAQTYDGAAAMSGVHCGVQALIRQKAAHAHYIHCRSHSSNLVVVKSAQGTTFGRKYFGVLEQLFVMIEGSAKRHNWFIEEQKAAGLIPKHLKALSDTRWNCQGRSVEVVRSRLAAVNSTVAIIRDQSMDRKVIGEAIGLLACTTKFEFVIATEFFAKLLSPLDTLTRALQGPDSTLRTVVLLSNAAHNSIEHLRNSLDDIIGDAKKLAEQCDIETEIEERRLRKVSRRIDSGENEVALSAVDELKRQMMEVTDIALLQLKTRFLDTSGAGRLYQLAGSLMTSDTACEELHDHINALYPDATDVDVAVAQFDLVRHIPAWIKALTLQERAAACPPSMVELRRIYALIITVPVTSAGCERTFSKLALIKNKLRTTCGQDRLEKLVMCSVERDIVQNIEMDRVIDRFAKMNRRIRL